MLSAGIKWHSYIEVAQTAFTDVKGAALIYGS